MAEKKFKVLFITHDTGNYGASRSLQVLLKNYPQADADLIVQKRFLGRHDHEALRERFGGRIGKIREAYLPFDNCYQYGRKGRLFTLLLRLYNRLWWGLSRKGVLAFIAAGGYDFIHLNSLVLHPLISDRQPFVLHMRDVYDGTNPGAVESVKKAAGVIFIDEATRAPFRSVALRSSIVLNNPCDMTRVASYAGSPPPLPGLDVKHHTVFGVIGVASEKKGTGFIIRSFLKVKDERSRLLIVGGREKAALAEYRKLAATDPRVIFWGEESDIMKVYAASDYVLRGEEFPCIGRTVYEGLYAGCRVILPGDPQNPPPMFEYDRYRDSIYFYRPRSEGELILLFRKLAGSKVQDRVLCSNVDAYIRRFHKFVLDAVGVRP